MSLDMSVKTYGRSKFGKGQPLLQQRQGELFDAIVAGGGSGGATSSAASSTNKANPKAQIGYDPYLFDSDDEPTEAPPPVLSPAWKSQHLLSLKSPSSGGSAKTPKRKQPRGQSPGGAAADHKKKKLTPTAPRGRGRPPKEAAGTAVATPASVGSPRPRGRPSKEERCESASKSPAKKRGRPPKHQQQESPAADSPMKKPGRPPKLQQQESTPGSPAKKPGRPPKHIGVSAPLPPRGRPPGSGGRSPARGRGSSRGRSPVSSASRSPRGGAAGHGGIGRGRPSIASSTSPRGGRARLSLSGLLSRRGRPSLRGLQSPWRRGSIRSQVGGSLGRSPRGGSLGRSPRGGSLGRSPRGGSLGRSPRGGSLGRSPRGGSLGRSPRGGSLGRSPRGGSLGRSPRGGSASNRGRGRVSSPASAASTDSPAKRQRIGSPSPLRRGGALSPGRPLKTKDAAAEIGVKSEKSAVTPKRRGRPPKTPPPGAAATVRERATSSDQPMTAASPSRSRSPLPSSGNGDDVQSSATASSSATPKRSRGRPPKQAARTGLAADSAVSVSPARTLVTGAASVMPSPRHGGRPAKQQQTVADRDRRQGGQEAEDGGTDSQAGTVARTEPPTPVDPTSSVKRPRGRPPKKPRDEPATAGDAAAENGGSIATLSDGIEPNGSAAPAGAIRAADTLELASNLDDAASATPANAVAAKRGRGRPPRNATPSQAAAAVSVTASDQSSNKRSTSPLLDDASGGNGRDDLSDTTVAASTVKSGESESAENADEPVDRDRAPASCTVAAASGASETKLSSADKTEAGCGDVSGGSDDTLGSGEPPRQHQRPVAPAASIFSSGAASAPTVSGSSSDGVIASSQPDSERGSIEQDEEEEAEAAEEAVPLPGDGSRCRPPVAQSKRFVRTPRTKTQTKYSYNPRPWSAADDEQSERQRRQTNSAELGASGVSSSVGGDEEEGRRNRVAEAEALFDEGPPPSTAASGAAEPFSSQSSLSTSLSQQSSSGSASSSSQHRARHSAADEGEQPRIRKSVTWPTRTGDSAVTSLKVRKACKELYTVVHNVKHASECQESGESQQFDDDLEYLLEGMKDSAAYSTRCLSALSLAAKCASPAFRMHLKAEGTVIHIFQLLQDACSDKGLALCTACVMYMLSRDRLNMDLDKRCLALMVQLLSESAPPSGTDKEYEKVKDKVVSLCCPSASPGSSQELQPADADGVLNGADISAAHLAMESLLSLTSRRAGDWFKEELRLLGGLDHIVDAVADCQRSLSAGATDGDGSSLGPSASDRLLKICRCLRVLENVTFLNTENQEYLMSYEDGLIIPSLCSLLSLCEATVCAPSAADSADGESSDEGKLGSTVLQALLSALRLLLNLTHDNVSGVKPAGSGGALIDCCVRCVLRCPQRLPSEQRFDVFVLGLGLLVNLVEHSAANRTLLIALRVPNPAASEEGGGTEEPVGDDSGAVSAICKMFLQRMQAADKLEKEANEGPATAARSGAVGTMPANGEDLDECAAVAASSHDDTLTEILHKAGKHMEDSIVAAYAALVLGCLVLGRGGADGSSSAKPPPACENEAKAETFSRDSNSCLEAVRACLPDGNLRPLVDVLQKFLGFIKLTDAASSTGSRSIADVISALERACC